MIGQDRNDIGSIGAQEKKTKRPGRHPLLVGALAAGLVALGASAAVAVGIPADPPPVPLTMSESDMKMPSHKEMNMMGETDARTGTGMMGSLHMNKTGLKGMSMMGGSDMNMPGHKGMGMATGKGAGAGTCTMGTPTLGA